MFSLKIIARESYFWICSIAIAAVAIFNALIPYTTSKILNFALAQNFRQALLWFLLMVAVILSLLLFEAVSQYYAVKYKNRLTHQLTERVSQALARLNTADFKQKNHAYYSSLYNHNLKMIEDDYYQKLLDLFQGLVGIAANAGVLFVLDRTLMVVVLLASVVPILVPFVLRKSLNRLKKEHAQQLKNYNEKLNDFINGFHIAKNYRIETVLLQRLSDSVRASNRSKEDYEKRSVQANIVSGISFYLSFIVTILVGALRVSQGVTTIGAVVATIQISDNLIYPIHLLSEESKNLLATKEIRREIEQLCLTQPAKTTDKRIVTALPESSVIQLVNLSFKQAQVPLFENLSFTFQAGKKYLLTGESGVGKSTLLKILSGDLLTYSGKVLIDPNTAQQQRFVYQDSYMFSDTLKNNLTLFDTSTHQGLPELLTLTNLQPFAQQLDQQQRYSGGEQQRINLVRALLTQPAVLFLDEATSALDQQNYLAIEQGLLANFEGTLIAVSHRNDPLIVAKYDYVLEVKDRQLNVIGGKAYASQHGAAKCYVQSK